MPTKILHGTVESGAGNAENWPIVQIRETTGYPNLEDGTLNLRLDVPHVLRRDYELLRTDRKDGGSEDLRYERCCLILRDARLAALIARTSTNYWTNNVLEIMAEEHLRNTYGLKDGDPVAVEVCVEDGTP